MPTRPYKVVCVCSGSVNWAVPAQGPCHDALRYRLPFSSTESCSAVHANAHNLQPTGLAPACPAASVWLPRFELLSFMMRVSGSQRRGETAQHVVSEACCHITRCLALHSTDTNVLITPLFALLSLVFVSFFVPKHVCPEALEICVSISVDRHMIIMHKWTYRFARMASGTPRLMVGFQSVDASLHCGPPS